MSDLMPTDPITRTVATDMPITLGKLRRLLETVADWPDESGVRVTVSKGDRPWDADQTRITITSNGTTS